MWEILLTRQWGHRPTWQELWDELDDHKIQQLQELYDVLPEPLRRLLDEHMDGRRGA